MNTTKQLLSELNIIREAKHMKPLKSWKGSAATLAAQIAKHNTTVTSASPAVAEGAYKTAREATHRTGVKVKRVVPNDHKPKKSLSAAAKKPAAKAVRSSHGSGEITLAEIARELDLNPKVARSKARRNAKDLSPLQVKGKKYVYATGDKQRVKGFLNA